VATPTIFLDDVNSFLIPGSGIAFADAVIHSNKKKPAKKREFIYFSLSHEWPTFS